MKSNWQSAKETSKYHFDPIQAGSSYDAAPKLGKFAGNSWYEETKQVITSSVPATWATRGYKHKGDVSPDIAAEEYDLTSAGAPADLVICRMEWDIPPTIQKMADAFGLDDLYCRIHVQFAGEVFNMHIDKLQKWNPEDPSLVKRFMIHLNDWSFGQIIQYGTHNHTQWKSGDVHTFDWENVPHGSANM